MVIMRSWVSPELPTATFLPFRLAGSLNARISDQVKGHFLCLKVNAFERSSLESRAHAAATATAKVDVAAQERCGGQRTRDYHSFIFEPFIAEEASRLGDVN